MKKVIKCPKCKLTIVADEFERHLSYGHDVGGEFDRQESDEDDDLYDRYQPADFLQPNLDASKDLGYPCREGGAFGSYSSIDGFDDESWS